MFNYLKDRVHLLLQMFSISTPCSAPAVFFLRLLKTRSWPQCPPWRRFPWKSFHSWWLFPWPSPNWSSFFLRWHRTCCLPGPSRSAPARCYYSFSWSSNWLPGNSFRRWCHSKWLLPLRACSTIISWLWTSHCHRCPICVALFVGFRPPICRGLAVWPSAEGRPLRW